MVDEQSQEFRDIVSARGKKRIQAAEQLVEAGQEGWKALGELLVADTPALRKLGAKMLTKCGVEATSVLEPATSHDDPAVRSLAFGTLLELPVDDPTAVRFISIALKDNQAKVKKVGVEAAKKRSELEPLLPALLELVESADRRSLKAFLYPEQPQGKDLAEVLIKLTTASSSGPPNITEMLIRFLKNILRKDASESLKVEFCDVLVDLARSTRSTSVKKAILGALGPLKINSPEVKSLLQSSLSDKRLVSYARDSINWLGLWGQIGVSLDGKVIRAIEKLGGTVPDTAVAGEIQGHKVGGTLMQLDSVTWPAGQTYASKPKAKRKVWMVEPSRLWFVEPKEFQVANRGRRVLFAIAMADGGNYLVVIDAMDEQTTNPLVWVIDHYDPQQQLYGNVRLSEFFSSLKVERKAALNKK